jgi:ribosomal protein S18 acetylase RimI-like enzyme
VHEVRIAAEPADSAVAAGLLDRYYTDLASRFPAGSDVFDGARVAAPLADLVPPRGTFLVAWIGGTPAGCGAVRSLGPAVAEIKRMWVDPLTRGRGVGRRLLQALERAAAAELGAVTVRLDTAVQLDEALALYRSAGYAEIRPYNDNPYAAHWLEKRLG